MGMIIFSLLHGRHLLCVLFYAYINGIVQSSSSFGITYFQIRQNTEKDNLDKRLAIPMVDIVELL
jgi:hypothetical protein